MNLGDFRPISLIGSLYKIIAKLLSNRLRRVIPSLVRHEQSAFLKGRFILDGALIVNETIDFMKAKKVNGLVFKADFEKAFDSINWDFLLEVMKSMGFKEKWRKWIMACLKSASISVLVNGSPTKEFSLERGIRQGDPLSPFLFILAAEGLNIMTKAATEKGCFKGVEVGSDKILVSHLQYADDTIFIGEWSKENVCNLHKLLTCFELASGLKVNFHKSFLYGIGVNEIELHSVATIIGCKVGKFPFTYLGIPTGSKMKKLKDWEVVINKIKSRLSDWKTRTLSFGGRDGTDTAFWTETWLGDFNLSQKYPRLFKLERQPDVRVCDRVRIDNNSCSTTATFDWVRTPSGRTKSELESLVELLEGYKFDSNRRDKWRWTLASNGRFTVKKLSVIIDEHLLGMEIFAWRVSKKRIPVRTELDKRGIDLHSVRCPLCDDDVESVDHSLIFCSHAIEVWNRVFGWWGLGNFTNFSIEEILSGKASGHMSPLGAKVWQAIGWVSVYFIWKNRNIKVFQGKSRTAPMTLNEIQTKSFEWISQRIRGKKIDWLTWLSTPNVYFDLA
ncbi:uncharacterized protein [Rutidosis leptorrhynchoides]|uniref:uncharacterized protein n=1 Tax=Rutidosis leptorrhynchoides TaxID=125765 RepID=UPI003A99D32B